MKYAMVALGSILLGAGSAVAQPPVVVTVDPGPSRVVSYADLNIWSKAGQDRLVNRIRAAATDLCIENNRAEVKVANARRSCFNTALSGGLKQMDMAIAGRNDSTFAAATLTISGQ